MSTLYCNKKKHVKIKLKIGHVRMYPSLLILYKTHDILQGLHFLFKTIT